ncbi:MAG: rhomboid family intramembrane serine protease [Bacilli bacterium]
MNRNLKMSVTNVIIIINIVVFISIAFSGKVNQIYYLFGINSPITSKYITFLTSAFIHGSIMHLLFNMYFLFYMGPILENYLGKNKYLLYYLGCAMLSGFLTEMFSAQLVIGASGILYAMVTTCITLDKSDSVGFTIYNSRALINLLLINIVLTFILPGISIVGHISGIVVGLIAALIIISVKERR